MRYLEWFRFWWLRVRVAAGSNADRRPSFDGERPACCTRINAFLRSIGVVVACGIFHFSAQPGFANESNSRSPLIVGNDRGGSLRERIYEIRALRETGQPVMIVGDICYSTCTMYLGLPQTCIAPNTVFGFHGPSSYGRPLAPDVFERASVLIKDHYPQVLQDWYMTVARHEIRMLYRIPAADMVRYGVQPC